MVERVGDERVGHRVGRPERQVVGGVVETGVVQGDVGDVAVTRRQPRGIRRDDDAVGQ